MSSAFHRLCGFPEGGVISISTEYESDLQNGAQFASFFLLFHVARQSFVVRKEHNIMENLELLEQ